VFPADAATIPAVSETVKKKGVASFLLPHK
jgi:hypothetical protein